MAVARRTTTSLNARRGHGGRRAARIHRMDFIQTPSWMLAISAAMMLFQFAWWVIVLVILFRIWGKVRHLPG